MAQSRAAPVALGRIAFLGTAASEDSTLSVLALCWPARPDAWTRMTQANRDLREGRPPPIEGLGRPLAPSWVRLCAPQLAAPFHGTAAEESSIATLIARTPIQIAIAVLEVPAHRLAPADSPPLQAWADCLAVHDGVVARKFAEPVALIVAEDATAPIQASLQSTVRRCRETMPQAAWLRQLEMRFWHGRDEPVPLELARLVATAMLHDRTRVQGDRPIVKAVLGKLANPPLPPVLMSGLRR